MASFPSRFNCVRPFLPMVLAQNEFCLSRLPPLKAKIYLWSDVNSSLFFTLKKLLIFGKHMSLVNNTKQLHIL